MFAPFSAPCGNTERIPVTGWPVANELLRMKMQGEKPIAETIRVIAHITARPGKEADVRSTLSSLVEATC